MKKVIALMLAVLMLATIAFASSDIAPGDSIKISRDVMGGSDFAANSVNGTSFIIAETDAGDKVGDGFTSRADILNYIPRSVTSANYSITNTKFKIGKGLVESVSFNDSEERVEITMAEDLSNTKTKDFEVSFKLKGKAKYTLKSVGEIDSYIAGKYDSAADHTDNRFSNLEAGQTKVTLPSLDFSIIGTVGYGQVQVRIGDDSTEEITNLESLYNDEHNSTYSADTVLSSNIFRFSRTTTAGQANTTNTEVPMAGTYTADVILTQEYGDALTLEARVYDGDKLYFGVKYTPLKPVINRLADSDGDLDFYRFSTNKDFTTLNSNAKLCFNDADEDCFVYKINDNGYLVPTGEYSEEDGCWVVKTRTLGQYVVSDVELHDNVVADGDPATTNPDTGANDVVGIAAALAAVALVSAAAISLKK